jgi:hypothetical protein
VSESDGDLLVVLVQKRILELVSCVTVKRIFSSVSRKWADDEAIEVFCPSQVSKEDLTRFSVRGKTPAAVSDITLA